ncbi:hypothetical protein NQ176_g10476 [Zarea fungicola]|uniref:Uncharacterized protein n=1 Tax=Zarea fungicola TaxID=93591 RepID=A0ACC1MHK9_9HYPO|nr:hypothetical protein NQ176_g10476 [Lecanicillium fungicola]
MVKRRASVSSASDNEVAHKAAKKTKTSSGLISPAGKDDDGNAYWEASCQDITWRGISLSTEQYATLLKLVPSINNKLREMGKLVDGSEDATAVSPVAVKKQKKEKSDRANIDATSDEDDG